MEVRRDRVPQQRHRHGPGAQLLLEAPGVALHQVDLRAWVLVAARGEDRPHERRGEVGREPDAQLVDLLVGQRVEQAGHAVGVGEQLLRLGQQAAPERRQLHLPRGAPQQPAADAILQRADALAERRLRHV